MERKVGEIFKYGSKTLEVSLEGKDCCKGCFFKKWNDCNVTDLERKEITGECARGFRKDETGVIFRLVESEESEQQPTEEKPQNNVRSHNVGNSDYAKHSIQPWDLWIEYKMNPFDADIQKRLIRKKKEPGMSRLESRKLDYEKIIHICQERLRQLNKGFDPFENKEEEE